MPETDTPATTSAVEEQIRRLTPPEYIKLANARDSKIRHAVDLEHFITWMQTNSGLLRELPAEKIPTLVEDYLAGSEPKDSTP